MTKDQSTVALNGSEKYDPLYNYPLFYVATCKDPKLVWSSKKQYLEINQSPNWKVFYNFLAYESGKKKRRKKEKREGGRERGRKKGKQINSLLLPLNLLSSPCSVLYFCILSCYFSPIADFILSGSLVVIQYVFHSLMVAIIFYNFIYWHHADYNKYVSLEK